MGKFLFLLPVAVLAAGCTQKEYAGIELLGNSWEMSYPAEASAVLEKGTAESGEICLPDGCDSGFTVRFHADLAEPDTDRCILEIGEMLDVTVRQHNPLDRSVQNYPAFSMPDGSVPVLEASLLLESQVDGSQGRMRIGIPLAMLDEPYGEHEVVLTFSGARWTMYVDGKLLDNDFPVGYPPVRGCLRWKIDTSYIDRAGLYFPAVESIRDSTRRSSPAPVPVQYWTPPGHNSWVGDVVSIFHDGRYHIFYLYDRRGHQSKFGKGGHYFEHLSTADFIHWTEHEAAVPIDRQWETFGTGTPFVKDGRMYLSYGYHTTRIYPVEMTCLPQMYDSLEVRGQTVSFNVMDLDKVPAGSSYSYSDDGINFKKSGVLFHPCENPSIFIDSTGMFRMFANYGARGTWESGVLDSGWHCVDKDFPPGGDCTFFFDWNGYDYVIGGFTGMWSKRTGAPDTEYRDMTAEGLDFYNGMCVPSVSRIADGRYLMAGWIWLKEWGGALAIHELVQLEDGRLGTRWMEELVPETENRSFRVECNIPEPVSVPSSSFMLTFDVVPDEKGQGNVSVTFYPDSPEGDHGCRWSLDLKEGHAEYAALKEDGTCDRQKSLREGGSLRKDYAIENIAGTDMPFTVRMIVKTSGKLDGSVVDTEIAGKRTMLSYRDKFRSGGIMLSAGGASVRNIRLKALAGED